MRLTSRDRLIGAIGRVRALVAVYASVLTGVTVLDIVGGIYFIFQLFHGYGDEQIKKCQAQADQGAPGTVDAEHWACSAGFKTGRTIVVVVYVIWWLIEICESPRLRPHCFGWQADLGIASGSADGCVIAFEYVGQLREEEEAKFSDREKAQSQNVTIVTQPAAAYGQPQPYPFAAPQNSYGPEYKEEPL